MKQGDDGDDSEGFDVAMNLLCVNKSKLNVAFATIRRPQMNKTVSKQ